MKNNLLHVDPCINSICYTIFIYGGEGIKTERVVRIRGGKRNAEENPQRIGLRE